MKVNVDVIIHHFPRKVGHFLGLLEGIKQDADPWILR